MSYPVSQIPSLQETLNACWHNASLVSEEDVMAKTLPQSNQSGAEISGFWKNKHHGTLHRPIVLLPVYHDSRQSILSRKSKERRPQGAISLARCVTKNGRGGTRVQADDVVMSGCKEGPRRRNDRAEKGYLADWKDHLENAGVESTRCIVSLRICERWDFHTKAKDTRPVLPEFTERLTWGLKHKQNSDDCSFGEESGLELKL